MDPNANLKEQLEIAERLVNGDYPGICTQTEDSLRLAELVLALDGWIKGGGFLPTDWKR